MSKTFTYENTISVYNPNIDENEDVEVDEFEYEVEDEELITPVVDLIYQDYFNKPNATKGFENSVKTSLRNFIEEVELVEELADFYEDELQDFFEDDAMAFYEEQL